MKLCNNTLAIVWAICNWVTYTWAYWVKWTVTTRMLSSFLSLAAGTGNQCALAPGDGNLQCFPWGHSAVSPWRWHTGSISWHAPSLAQPFRVKRNSCTSGWALFWGLNSQSHHGILPEWSPCAWMQYQLKQCLLGPSWPNFSVQDTLPHFEVVELPKELPELWRVSLLVWALTQGHILHLCNYLTQDGVCQLGLLPVTGGHTGDLQTVLYQVGDMQVTAVHFNGTYRALKGGLLHNLYCCCSDLVVDAWGIGHAHGPGHPQLGIHVEVGLPHPII